MSEISENSPEAAEISPDASKIASPVDHLARGPELERLRLKSDSVLADVTVLVPSETMERLHRGEHVTIDATARLERLGDGQLRFYGRLADLSKLLPQAPPNQNIEPERHYCAECRVVLLESRVDSVFCGSACKQKAYRRRVEETLRMTES